MPRAPPNPASMTPASTALRRRSETARAAELAAWREGYVPRAALVRRLCGAQDASVAVIVAPPGYGKSGLLSEWAEQDQRPFLWLRFGQAGANRKAKADAAATLVTTLRAQKRRFVLALDDVHLAPPSVARELVRVVLDECPEGSTVALSSRREPPLPLGRLRASHALVEVRVDDLAMRPAEAGLLLRMAGLELDLTSVQTLVRRTEGWPAGLYLASLCLRGQADIAEAVAHVRGDSHPLAEYFRDEVLPALSPVLREFAVKTSVLDELSGPVCDAVLERVGSALVLGELEQASPLLRPVDAAHERYRWHALFRDVLSAELRRSDPQLVGTLHDRASAWYQSQGDTERAISHAVGARDCIRTGDLLWPSIVAYVTQGRNDIVQGWLASFSEEELAGYAPLALCAAHSFLVAGNAAEARHWAIAGSAALGRDPSRSAADAPPAGFAGINAMLGGAGVVEMGQAAADACRIEPEDSPWRPIWLLLEGTALHLAGHRSTAAPLLEAGADIAAATAPSVTALCLAQAAMIAIEGAEWDTATDLTDRAVRVIEERGLIDYPICTLAFAAAAATRAHQGRADEAKRDLRRGVDLLAALGDFLPWYGAEARILLAHASLWLADLVGARTLLAEASRLARRTAGAVIFARWFDDAWSYMDTLAETSLGGPSSLTIAELRILRFLPSHLSFREIGERLHVSGNTVKTQAHAVYRKLGAASRSEAVTRAAEAGLLGQ
jgi:LuxR family transcriptional regulator, maltose regulon positive regulatory protein